MTQFYFDPSREGDKRSLPDAEVFYAECGELGEDGDGDPLPAGWYWWPCFPGCMPDGDPCGPFDTEADAIADAQNFD